MTRREQLSIANEIAVLCGIASTYFSSHAPPTPDAAQAIVDLDDMAARFLDMTEPIVDDPQTRGLCPACGEEQE